MPTILPPPSTPLPLPTASPAATVTIPSPPPELAQLPAGTLLRAEVVQILSRGLVEARTEFGVVQLRTSAPVAEGTKLDLQAVRTTPALQLTVRGIDGRPVSDASVRIQTPLSSQSASVAAPIATQATPTSALASLAVGAIVRAVFATPSNAPPVLPAHALTPTPNGAQSSSRPPPAAAPAAIPTALQPGTLVQARVTAIGPPGPLLAPPTSQGPAAVNALNGTVTAITPDGRPIVQTPVGVLTIEASADDVRIGTQLQLALETVARPTSAAPRTFPATFVQQRTWPALEEAVDHLAQRPTPSDAQPVAAPLIQSNNRLAANLMMFLTALKGGGIAAWLGRDASALLESERPELARQLNEEFAQLARILNESRGDDWRTIILPFFNGAHLEPVQMHLRGGKGAKAKMGDDDGSRFIIDVTLSRLGRIQLDGFIKKRGKDKKTFDLIVRTDQPLPQQMRRDINHIFTDFAEAAGIPGAIAFHARDRFVEVPLARLGGSAKDGLIV